MPPSDREESLRGEEERSPKVAAIRTMVVVVPATPMGIPVSQAGETLAKMIVGEGRGVCWRKPSHSDTKRPKRWMWANFPMRCSTSSGVRLRQTTNEAVIAASGRPEDCFRWMLEAEHPQATFESLAHSGEFLTLDMKLAASIAAQSTGEIGRQLSLRKAEQKRLGVMLRGRQLLWLIGEYCKTNDEAGAMYELGDLMNVKVKKDGLETFE